MVVSIVLEETQKYLTALLSIISPAIPVEVFIWVVNRTGLQQARRNYEIVLLPPIRRVQTVAEFTVAGMRNQQFQIARLWKTPLPPATVEDYIVLTELPS